MRRVGRAVVAFAVLVGACAGATVLVRMANGDYAGDYRLTGYFPSAGEGLQPGSEVVFRGVQVGRVSTISLAGTRARVTVLIEPQFKVPADAVATIEPVNLFGAEQVSLTTPSTVSDPAAHVDAAPTPTPAAAPAAQAPTATTAPTSTTVPQADTGPYLAPGATFAHARSSDEIGDLFAAAVPLLDKITATTLSNVVSELAQASDGQGPTIARSIGAGAGLAGYLDRTLDAQLDALDAFADFTAATAGDGTAINAFSGAANRALPPFDQAATYYDELLANLTPFADHLATLLADYHPTIATLLSRGDDIAKVLLAQQTAIGQVIAGAYAYAYKVGSGGSAEALPNGSRFAYFNTFILFGDVNTLVCDLLTPDAPGLSYLEPVQQALVGSGTSFTCKSQLAAFDALQTTATAPASLPAAAPGGSVPTAASLPGATAVSHALGTLGSAVDGLVGAPGAASSQTVATYVSALLGSAL